MAFNSVPANGWPQIKELEKLDAIASQIENMPTFTSDDRAFLEDLPSYPETDGTKMLTATTTSGETSLSYEDIPEELPEDPQSDGTRVLTATTSSGTTVKSWEEYQSNMDYSTTEQDTGQKWTDGSPIYVRTEVHDIPSSVAAGITRFNDTSFAANLNVLKSEVVMELDNGVLTPGMYTPWYVQGTVLYAGLDATGLGVYFGGNLYAGNKVHVTLYYTKAAS